MDVQNQRLAENEDWSPCSACVAFLVPHTLFEPYYVGAIHASTFDVVWLRLSRKIIDLPLGNPAPPARSASTPGQGTGPLVADAVAEMASTDFQL